LADWSSGFLSGYAMSAAAPDVGGLGEEDSEVLKDVAAIAAATVDAERDLDESENHYFELTEYLRFATLNLFMNAITDREKPGVDPGNA
jgi:uncharacterized protein YgfB (UPF0149 family)